jgi:hypothetical protein
MSAAPSDFAERACRRVCGRSKALRAFVEKRKPVYQGR